MENGFLPIKQKRWEENDFKYSKYDITNEFLNCENGNKWYFVKKFKNWNTSIKCNVMKPVKFSWKEMFKKEPLYYYKVNLNLLR